MIEYSNKTIFVGVIFFFSGMSADLILEEARCMFTRGGGIVSPMHYVSFANDSE